MLKILLISIITFLSTFINEADEIKDNIQSKNSTNQIFKVLVEIPSSSIEKWEWNENNKSVQRDSVRGKPRIINYLNYPFNYGIVLNQKLSEDGDPLDAVVIGKSIKREKIIDVKLISILKTLDNGLEDNKAVFIHKSSPLFKNVDSLEDLNKLYPGISEIIKIWFKNYKLNTTVLDFLSTKESIGYLYLKSKD
ncbi:inorganic diphosphatase [bacterium]|nr:inorganic diphosphatase [bacterium]